MACVCTMDRTEPGSLIHTAFRPREGRRPRGREPYPFTELPLVPRARLLAPVRVLPGRLRQPAPLPGSPTRPGVTRPAAREPPETVPALQPALSPQRDGAPRACGAADQGDQGLVRFAAGTGGDGGLDGSRPAGGPLVVGGLPGGVRRPVETGGDGAAGRPVRKAVIRRPPGTGPVRTLSGAARGGAARGPPVVGLLRRGAGQLPFPSDVLSRRRGPANGVSGEQRGYHRYRAEESRHLPCGCEEFGDDALVRGAAGRI